MRYDCAMWRFSDAGVELREHEDAPDVGVEAVADRDVDQAGILPPIGTAGFERCWVKGNSRVPRPPPRTRARTSLFTLVFVPDVLAVHHIDYFLADVGGVVGDALE